MNSPQYFCNEEQIYIMVASMVFTGHTFRKSKYVPSTFIIEALKDTLLYLYTGSNDYFIESYHYVEKWGRDDWDTIIDHRKVLVIRVRLI